MILKFEKQDGQPNSAYQLSTIDYVKNGTSVLYTNQVTTLRETGTYVFSGTFSGTASVQGVQSTITDGVFTDVKLLPPPNSTSARSGPPTCSSSPSP